MRRRLRWLVPAGLLLVLGLAYVALHLVAGDQVPRGATVAGVTIGGLSADDAVDRLEEALGPRIDQPITARVEGRTEEFPAHSAGLAVDFPASVERAGGRSSWAPARLWEHVAGGAAHRPVITGDDDRLRSAITRLEGGLGTKARDGAIRFKGAKVREIAPVVGRGLDPETTQDSLVAAFTDGLSGDPATAELHLVDVPPQIDADDLAEARAKVVRPATSGPVTLLFGDYPVALTPRDFLPVLRLVPKEGELVASLDGRRLRRLLERFTAERGKAVDATVRIQHGKPVVVPGKPGVTYDEAQVRSRLLAAITSTGAARRTRITTQADAPDFTTAHARALKITEVVSEFTTHYPHADYRNVNIGRAAELINGTVLKPGEVFSYNGTVGERTRENGFTDGYMIDHGILKLSAGGGVSQLATTTFNAMFFAGLKDVEHKPHSFYIDRYPVGREATVAWPSLDLKFENDTPYGVLVQAFVEPSTWSSQGDVTVRMWSTKYWDITTDESARYDPKPPKTRVLTTPDCEEHDGWSGFTVDVWRYFHRHGSDELVRKEKFHTVYTPADEVECEAPPVPEPENG